jgi:hypothetical protein
MAIKQMSKLHHLRSSALRGGVEPTDRQLLECFVKRRDTAAVEARQDPRL